MFSIIIAAYNEENNIKKCLDSIKNQNFKDFEVIIVDDGSNDNTYKICSEYNTIDSRFKVFRQKNSGVSVARNYGISLAKKEWIMFVDADDILSKNSLNVFKSLIMNTNCNIIQGSQIMNTDISEPTKIISYKVSAEKIQIYSLNRKKYKKTFDNNEQIIIESVHGCYGKAFNRKYLYENDIKFKDGLGLGEDLLFYIEALEEDKEVLVTNEIVYIINNNQFSSTRRKNYKMVKFAEDFSKYIYEYYNKYKKSDIFFKEMCYQIFVHFQVGVVQYYTHIDNKDSFKKRKKELKSNAKKDIFSKSIKILFKSIIKNEFSIKDKLSICLLRFNMYGIYLLFKSKQRIRSKLNG